MIIPRECLNLDELERLAAHAAALTEADVSACAHLDGCAACRRQYRRLFTERHPSAATGLAQMFTPEHDVLECPEPELLLALAEDQMEAFEAERIQRHLSICLLCKAELAELEALHGALLAYTPEPDSAESEVRASEIQSAETYSLPLSAPVARQEASSGPLQLSLNPQEASSSIVARSLGDAAVSAPLRKRGWWANGFSPRSFGWAASIAAIAIVAVLIYHFRLGSEEEHRRIVAWNAEKIRLGNSPQPPGVRQLLGTNALTFVERGAARYKRLHEGVQLMGPNSTREFVEPVFPVSAVIETNLPHFQWKPFVPHTSNPMPPVDHYHIEWQDTRNIMVSPKRSVSIPAAQLEWELPADQGLIPGHTYTWQVKAFGAPHKKGETSLAGGGGQFTVLDTDTLAQLKQYANSPLGLAVLYTEVGMPKQAEKALDQYLETTPGFPPALQLKQRLTQMQRSEHAP